MTDEIDIYRAAKAVIGEHGDEAALHASMMADKFLEKGDVVAASMWKLILAKVDELQEFGVERHTLH